MRGKTAKYIVLAACAMMLLLYLAASATGIGLFYIAGGAAAFAGVLCWLLFGRCPSCGRFLGRTDGSYCPHCGKKIPW